MWVMASFRNSQRWPHSTVEPDGHVHLGSIANLSSLLPMSADQNGSMRMRLLDTSDKYSTALALLISWCAIQAITDGSPRLLASANGGIWLVCCGNATWQQFTGKYQQIRPGKDIRPLGLEDAAAALCMSPWGVVRKPDRRAVSR